MGLHERPQGRAWAQVASALLLCQPTSVRDLTFLSREDRDLGVAFQTPPGSQASSRGEAKDSALLSSRDAPGSPVPSTPERREGLRACYWEGPSELPSAPGWLIDVFGFRAALQLPLCPRSEDGIKPNKLQWNITLGPLPEQSYYPKGLLHPSPPYTSRVVSPPQRD